MPDEIRDDMWPSESADTSSNDGALPNIAPLERLVVPRHLTGTDGTHRCKEPCLIDADDDLTAVLWWVQRTSNNDSTASSRRNAMDKLLNWAYFKRGKPVSSLSEEDFASFARFLARPEPMQDWVGSRCARDSASWRPFAKPLDGKARDVVLKHTASVVHWLGVQRYADLRFVYGKRAQEDGFASVPVASAGRQVSPMDQLTIDEWHWVRRTLDLYFPSEDDTPQRLIVEMLYYGELHVEEVAALTLRDFEPPSGLAPGWSFWVQGRPAWRGGGMVCAAPPLSDTIGRWFKRHEPQRKDHLTFRIRDRPTPLVDVEGGKAAALARQVLRMASGLALRRGAVQLGLQLRERTLVSLRGAFSAHCGGSADRDGAAELTGRFRSIQTQLRRQPLKWDWRDAETLWTETLDIQSWRDEDVAGTSFGG